ncbi:MAG: A/G-specific adenine glycosylase [Chloroflexi bacterium]|nr:A/G-specific adenine glycosylase [Chloroflexota bacterium]
MIDQSTELASRLLAWYELHARRLPWRDDPQPYRVWVSEIMLQQTRVETVIPYFERWMARFPSLAALAAADEQAVLQAWEGLGYYSRARNLHRAVRQVVEKWGGEIPARRAQLEQLPGVGHYTSAAIASIAFGQDDAALDGNIRRVLGRVFNVTIPARSSAGEQLFWRLAEENLPPGQAGDYNQALMDLGATVCTPKAPACEGCPLAELCQARALGVQEERPVLAARPEVPHIQVAAAIIQRDGRLLIARRPSNGLLGGLWEYPGGKREDGEDFPACLRREILEELGAEVEVGELFGVYKHAYTHFKVTLHAFRCRLVAGEPQALQASQLRWVTVQELGDYPMGKIDRRISDHLQGQGQLFSWA